MGVDSKVSRVEVTDYNSLLSAIDADVLVEEVGGFFVVDVDVQPMVSTADGSVKWVALIAYSKGGGSSPGSVDYTNLLPTTAPHGGWQAGSVFNAVPLSTMFDGVLYEAGFDLFEISGQANPLEVGESIPASVIFNWNTVNPAYVSPNTVAIRDVTNALDLATGLADDGSEAVVMPGAIQKTTQDSHRFQARATDTRSQTIYSEEKVYNWFWRVYAGSSSNTSLNEAEIKALTDFNSLSNTAERVYPFTGSGYKYLAIPVNLPLPVEWVADSISVPFINLPPVSITNSFGQTIDYNIQRSYYTIGTDIDISVIVSGVTGGDVAPIYTNPTPVPSAHGGVEAGESLYGLTMTQMFDRVLRPYLYPAFTSFGISGQANPLEVGDIIPASFNLVWGTTNPSNVQPNSIGLYDTTTPTTLGTGLANDGSEAIVLGGPIQKTVRAAHNFQIQGQNTKLQAMSPRNTTYSWIWRRYWGKSSIAGPLTEAQIEALANNQLLNGITGTFAFPASGSPEYCYLCFSNDQATPTTFKDADTGFGVDMLNGGVPYTVSVTNTFGQTILYKVLRTLTASTSALNLQVS